MFPHHWLWRRFRKALLKATLPLAKSFATKLWNGEALRDLKTSLVPWLWRIWMCWNTYMVNMHYIYVCVYYMYTYTSIYIYICTCVCVCVFVSFFLCLYMVYLIMHYTHTHLLRTVIANCEVERILRAKTVQFTWQKWVWDQWDPKEILSAHSDWRLLKLSVQIKSDCESRAGNDGPKTWRFLGWVSSRVRKW